MTCEPAAVPAARHWTAGQLGHMYDSAVPVDDVALVVSELVSNCVRADAHRFTLALEGHHDCLRVEAEDDAPGLPQPRTAASSETHGRGLLIVDALANDWGVQRKTEGKTVWAELPVADDAHPTFTCNHTAVR